MSAKKCASRKGSWVGRGARWLIASIAVLTLGGSQATAGFVSSWTASSGLLPDQISPAWTLFDTASPENPTLSGGKLTLSTSPENEVQYYRHEDPVIDPSAPFYIEARVRLVSGSSLTANRAPISVAFTTAANVGNVFFIGADEVFFIDPGDVKGPTAIVDTNDGFHTYRIEVNSGAISLYYDGVLTLSASTINAPSLNGTTERIIWGDLSLLASGTSEWVSFKHNALVAQAVPEPHALVLCVAGALGVIIGRVAFGRRLPQ